MPETLQGAQPSGDRPIPRAPLALVELAHLAPRRCPGWLPPRSPGAATVDVRPSGGAPLLASPIPCVPHQHSRGAPTERVGSNLDTRPPFLKLARSGCHFPRPSTKTLKKRQLPERGILCAQGSISGEITWSRMSAPPSGCWRLEHRSHEGILGFGLHVGGAGWWRLRSERAPFDTSNDTCR